MHHASVVSKFPSRYIKEHLAPKLVAYGIVVDRILEPGRIRDPLSFGDAPFVFVMHEMLSHSEYKRVERLIKRSNKRLIVLSRKVSSWHKTLQSVLPAQNTSQTNLTELVRRTIAFRREGKTFDAIAPEVVDHWETTAPNGKNLHTFLTTMLKQGKVDQSLVADLTNALKRQSPSNHSQSVPTDWEKLAILYAEENDRIRRDNQLLINQERRATSSLDHIRPCIQLLEQQLSLLTTTISELKRHIGG